jgi:hypothetical protein
MKKYCWAIQLKSGSLVSSMGAEFNNPVDVALFRTKKQVVAFLMDNPKLFATGKPVKVTVKIYVVGEID